ncbi:uncharacterized protein [Setaria viridis]|uniref:uncharacterized protein n=1 Tax=Setaria viridis TaxID=4556 RepID=UPI001493CE67|nr:uncharacterized protein LOC117856243 [Setaria viridis]
MAEKTLREFSIPSTDNVATGPAVDLGDVNFELKTNLINMVQASPFCCKPNEDANTHLQHFVGLCDTVTMRGVTQDAIRLCLFPFFLLGRAKQWLYKDKDVVNMWEKCSIAFLAKFFPLGKTNALVEKMVSNHGWSKERLQPRMRGMHTVKEMDMLAIKLDLLLRQGGGHASH